MQAGHRVRDDAPTFGYEGGVPLSGGMKVRAEPEAGPKGALAATAANP